MCIRDRLYPTRSLTKASLFAGRGKRTDAFVRFSNVVAERGGANTERDVRGFSVKLYTGACPSAVATAGALGVAPGPRPTVTRPVDMKSGNNVRSRMPCDLVIRSSLTLAVRLEVTTDARCSSGVFGIRCYPSLPGSPGLRVVGICCMRPCGSLEAALCARPAHSS